jgi:RNA polymerase sigma-70 factor (ECF subfamily)
VPDDHLREVVRIEGGRVLATLIRLTGDISLAEDAVQDAVVIALQRWARDGVPDNPGAWLTTTARNRALDRIRREAARPDRETAAVRLLDDSGDDPLRPTDELRLLFTCCHPALSADAHVPLALRTLCGLSTPEIAQAFLVSEVAMGQRISRAKRKIAAARIPYRIPDDHELPDRLPGVLSALYVMSTVGQHATSGAFDSRLDLADEAVRLARRLVALMPDEPECAGLLALLLATGARRAARLDSSGNVVLLADQDRSRWDHAAIAEAAALVEATLRRRRPGPLQIEAAIATLHGLAATWSATDLVQIVQLYRLLERHRPTAVVRVNRAAAEAELSGPERGLALLAEVARDERPKVERWHLFWSAKAELERRAGRLAESAASLDRALACPMNDADRALLVARRTAARQNHPPQR